MTWYTAHGIMYVKFRDGNQDKYPILENVILLNADSDEQALKFAEERCKEDEIYSDFEWGNRPADMLFAGIRKIIECCDSEDTPSHGIEMTYSQMEVDDKESLNKLVEGESVLVRYEEQPIIKNNETQKVEFTYDMFGRRLSKTVDGESEKKRGR